MGVLFQEMSLGTGEETLATVSWSVMSIIIMLILMISGIFPPCLDGVSSVLRMIYFRECTLKDLHLGFLMLSWKPYARV